MSLRRRVYFGLWFESWSVNPIIFVPFFFPDAYNIQKHGGFFSVICSLSQFFDFLNFCFYSQRQFQGLFWFKLLAPQLSLRRQEQKSKMYLATAFIFHNRIKSCEIGYFPLRLSLDE